MPDVMEALLADPFARLGVRTFVNCTGVRAINGNCVTLPVVQQAMEAASHHFVDLDELMEAVGARLADLTGAEFGIVTSGSAAAVALATAACVAGNDPERMVRLPLDPTDAPVTLLPSDQRFAYEQAMRMTGCRTIAVGSLAETATALRENNVALICLNGMLEGVSSLPLRAVTGLAKAAGVPVLVDAASLYMERTDPWLGRGADMVVYSGGKFLRGPHSTGLLLGTRRLVLAAWLNGAPHQAFGRPMKVSKEEIVGLLAAVEHWFAHPDRTAEEERWRSDLCLIASHLTRNEGVWAEPVPPAGLMRVARLRVHWDKSRYPLQGLALRARLLERPPFVMVDDIRAREGSIVLDPFNLQDGEAPVVASRIVEELHGAAAERERTRPAANLPSARVQGRWRLCVRFLNGPAEQELAFRQEDQALRGWHRTGASTAPLVGGIAGSTVHFTSAHPCLPVSTSYQFRGELRDDDIEGDVILGAATEAHWGQVFRSQFGRASWHAKRISADAPDAA